MKDDDAKVNFSSLLPPSSFSVLNIATSSFGGPGGVMTDADLWRYIAPQTLLHFAMGVCEISTSPLTVATVRTKLCVFARTDIAPGCRWDKHCSMPHWSAEPSATVEEEAEWLLLDLILISNNNNDNMFYYYILLCIYVARFCVHCFPRWRLPAHER